MFVKNLSCTGVPVEEEVISCKSTPFNKRMAVK